MDPKCYPANVWRKDVAQWPLLDLGKIFEYILENRDLGNDYIGKYKIQKAFSYFKSGFVGAIECVIEPHHANTVILRARVIPSQSVRDQPRELLVAIKMNGSLLTAWCSCSAGYGTTLHPLTQHL